MSLTVRAVAKIIKVLYSLFPEAGYYIFRDFSDHFAGRRTLEQIISRYRIQSMTIAGSQGVFEGSARDLDVIGRYAAQGSWSPKFLSLVLDYMGSGQTYTYVDIGANIGLTAIPVAAAGHKVVAFEPVTDNFNLLQSNAAKNGVSDCMTLHNTALLDKPGNVTFELSPSNHGDHRHKPCEGFEGMGESDWAVIEVSATTLDAAMSEIPGQFVVKLDTQGAEPLVISGGQETLSRASMILFEYSPYHMFRMGTDHSIMVRYLAQFDYVDVYSGEDECSSERYSGEGLTAFLNGYFEGNKTEAWGKYLNLVGRR